MFSGYNHNPDHLIRDLHAIQIKSKHLMAPKDATEKYINKGKSKLGEALNNYNTLRDAIDNDIEYSLSSVSNLGKKKETKKKFKIT